MYMRPLNAMTTTDTLRLRSLLTEMNDHRDRMGRCSKESSIAFHRTQIARLRDERIAIQRKYA